MRSRRRSRVCGPIRALALAVLALFAAAPACASPETLKRSLSNIAFGPLDIALSPVTAAVALRAGLEQGEDPRWIRALFALPGYVWILGVEIGGGAIREIAGLLEFVPGLGLIFVAADLDPLFDPAERNEALVDRETPVLKLKFGVNYLASPMP